METMNTLDKILLLYGVKPNKAKCEIAGIGALKSFSGCTDLTKKINTLGIHFSYDKKLENEENFIMHVFKIEILTKLVRMEKLTMEEKFIIFKSLAISNIIHLSLVTNIPKEIINKLSKIQK